MKKLKNQLLKAFASKPVHIASAVFHSMSSLFLSTSSEQQTSAESIEVLEFIAQVIFKCLTINFAPTRF